MNKLIIHTHFPATVAALLKTHQLVDGLPHLPGIGAKEDLEVYYPDDAISQSLAFWFELARGCGLISAYVLVMPWMHKEGEEHVDDTQEIHFTIPPKSSRPVEIELTRLGKATPKIHFEEF